MEYQHSSKTIHMKYHKFGRRRKSIFYVYDPISKKKSDYIINTGRSEMLESGYYENQVWGALHKAWRGYIIAKNKEEDDKMLHYADIIQECQNDLRLKVSSFPDIGKSTLAFYSLRAAQHRENMTNKNNNNNYNSNNQEQVSEVDQQYEQERFTDTYREDFTDDYH